VNHENPDPIKLNSDNCDNCGMTISNPKFAAVLFTTKGRTYKFDDISCLLDYKNDNKEKALNAGLYVANFLSDNKLLPVEIAVYIKGDNVKSPMGGNIAAFKDRESANTYAVDLAAEFTDMITFLASIYNTVQNASLKTIRLKHMVIEEQEIGNGIHCWKSDSIQVIGNKISGNRDGIYFEFVTNSVIWRNISFDNIRYGLHFMFSNNDAYFTNCFTNNGAGVAVMFSNHITMMNNTFRENWGDAAYGMLLKRNI
jgi:parallel beta-helix repeat protein